MRFAHLVYGAVGLIAANGAFAADSGLSSSDLVTSPYEACKNVVIVSRDKYKKDAAKWKEWESKCHAKVQLADDAGITKLDPLKEGAQYIDFATKIAEHVMSNLEKSRAYAQCSKLCFSGANSCDASLGEDSKPVSCADRRAEVLAGLKVHSRRARAELALTRGASDLLVVETNNVMSLRDDQRINTGLKEFETTTPNPVGSDQLQHDEFAHAQEALAKERAKVEQDYKNAVPKSKDNPELNGMWVSKKLMDLEDEHREKYRQIIYEDAPILAVIDPAKKFDAGFPVWEDAQIASAFDKLVQNADKTKVKVKADIDRGTLEFGRSNGEAIGRWLLSMLPGTKEQSDLLYYMGMKNQVEEVLQGDTQSCGIATAMANRLASKDMQNAGVGFASFFVGGPLLKAGSKGVAGVFRFGRALTGAEAVGATGASMGSAYLGDAFHRYNRTMSEVASRSGTGGNHEGTRLRSASDVADAKTNVALNLAFAPTLAPGGGWALGKTLYNSLSKSMTKDLPQIGGLMRKAGTSEAARDQAVDKWIAMKVKSAIQNGMLRPTDEAALKSATGAKILNELSDDIVKNNPNFFKDPKNFDFLMQTAATTLRHRPGDPADLGAKAKHLFVNFNPEAFQNWDPRARQGLMRVFNEAVEELRTTYAKDPVAYAKLQSDPEAQEKVMMGALKRAGVVDEKEAKAMTQCALPGGGRAL